MTRLLRTRRSVSHLMGFDCIFLAKTTLSFYDCAFLFSIFLSYPGGEGSRGGKGRNCKTYFMIKRQFPVCGDDGLGHKAPDGPRGNNGPPGRSKLVPLPYFVFYHCLV